MYTNKKKKKKMLVRQNVIKKTTGFESFSLKYNPLVIDFE